MLRATDRPVPPDSGQPTGRAPIVAATLAGSILVHAAALASAIGFFGDATVERAKPLDVVLVTLTTPSRSPAPATAARDMTRPAPGTLAGTPAVAMPVTAPADPVAVEAPTDAPAAPAPDPAKAGDAPPPARLDRPRPNASDAPPPTRATIDAAPTAALPADAPVPPPASAVAAISVAAVQRVEPASPPDARPSPPLPRTRPSSIRPAETPTIVARTAGSPDTAAAPATAPAPAARGPQLAALSGPPVPDGGTPATGASFSLGSAGNPAPQYPRRARQRGWEGRVVLQVAVDPSGRPQTVRIAQSSGYRILDDAAHRTIAGWTFQPAVRGGRPVAGEAIVPVVFRLN